MTDRVELTAPLGMLGRPVERFVVGPYVERLVRRRAALLKRFAEDGGA